MPACSHRRIELGRIATVAPLLAVSLVLAACGSKPAVPANANSGTNGTNVIADVYESEVSKDVYQSRNVTPGMEWGVGW